MPVHDQIVVAVLSQHSYSAANFLNRLINFFFNLNNHNWLFKIKNFSTANIFVAKKKISLDHSRYWWIREFSQKHRVYKTTSCKNDCL